jgi:hypothetical protein
VEASTRVTFYKTHLTFYHRDTLTVIDQNVWKTQVLQYTCLQIVMVFWVECEQNEVSEGALEDMS